MMQPLTLPNDMDFWLAAIGGEVWVMWRGRRLLNISRALATLVATLPPA